MKSILPAPGSTLIFTVRFPLAAAARKEHYVRAVLALTHTLLLLSSLVRSNLLSTEDVPPPGRRTGLSGTGRLVLRCWEQLWGCRCQQH